MKRQFSPRRNTNPFRAASWPLGVTVAIVVLFTIVRLIFPGTFVSLVSPLWRGGASLDAGVGSVFSGFTSKEKLATQNAALSAQIAMLMNQNAVLTARAQDLTKLLGSAQPGVTSTPGDQILAGVLASPPVSAYDTLVLGAGSSEGVVKGAMVTGTDGIPLGTIQSVTAHNSIVSLLSTSGLSTSGWVGESRTPLVLMGAGAGTFTASVPKDLAPTTGEIVYVPGPGAIPIGTVKSVDADPSSPSVALQITPRVNIFSLTWVTIARK
jgi:cell shape-determining protein MreC